VVLGLYHKDINMFSNIPLPKQSGEILDEGFSKMLEYLLKQRELSNTHQYQQGQLGMKGQELAETGQYHTGLLTNQKNELGIKRQEQDIKNQAAPLERDLTRSRILHEKAYANYLNLGGGRGGGVDDKKRLSLTAQALKDNPGITPERANQISNAWLDGSPTLPDGSPTPKLTGNSRDILENIHKNKAPVAVQNQAANMKVLASDLNNTNWKPLEAFSGLKGRMNYIKYATDMAAGKEVPQEFLDYETFRNITAPFIMDSLRKGFATTVVPKYVTATLGKASNPNSDWWHNPAQVNNDIKAVITWVNENAKKYEKMAAHGVQTNIENKNQSNENDPLGIR
jgi:hypothetical protein